MPHGPVRSAPRTRRCGFTLIELLTVFAIIGILFSITITAGRGILERGKINRAKAEMAVIGAALEQYKQHYGDYPWTPPAATIASFPTLTGIYVDSHESVILFNALCGNMGPKSAGPLATRGRSFVELSKLTLWLKDTQIPDPDAVPPPELLDNWFMDPWGKWYYYVYKKSERDPPDWKSPSFLLYSHGPDRECDIGPAEVSGFLTDVPGDATNADNLYYGRN